MMLGDLQGNSPDTTLGSLRSRVGAPATALLQPEGDGPGQGCPGRRGRPWPRVLFWPGVAGPEPRC